MLRIQGRQGITTGDSSEKENTPSLRDIESRHTCIIAAVFSWRETQEAVSVSTSKMGTHCKVAGRAKDERVRVIPTYKKCTKPECASIKGKSEAQTEVSVAQRGKYWKANGWGCHSQDTSQEDSGVRSTAEDSTGGLVEISRRGKSINI